MRISTAERNRQQQISNPTRGFAVAESGVQQHSPVHGISKRRDDLYLELDMLVEAMVYAEYNYVRFRRESAGLASYLVQLFCSTSITSARIINNKLSC